MRNVIITICIVLVFPLLVLGASGGGSDTFASALALFNQGKSDLAMNQFKTAVAEESNDPVRRITYGVALANTRDYDNAITEFKEAAHLDPADPTAEFLLEGSYRAIGMVAEAQKSGTEGAKRLGTGPMSSEPCSKLLARALEEHPDNAIAHNLFGDICQMRRRYQESIVHYKRATELAPGWVKPWFNLGMAQLSVDPAQAAACFKKVVALDPTNLQAEMWLGDAYAAERDYPQALQAYSMAANSKALEPDARARIGNVYLKQQELDQAATEFNKAIKAQPSNVAANAGLGDVYRGQKRLDESARQYHRASDLTQQSSVQQAIATNGLANVYIDKGDCLSAIRELKQAVGSSGQPEGAQMLFDAYSRCGMLSQGISDYEAVLRDHPGDVTAMRFLSAAYTAVGNARGRMEIDRRLLKTLPSETAVWSRELGSALLAMGDRSAAVEAWQHGLESGPAKDTAGIIDAARSAGLLPEIRSHYEQESETHKLATPSLILASICESSGDYAKAVEVRKRLVSLYPKNQQYWIWLGDAEKSAGRKPQAKDAYTKAAAMDNDVTLRAIALDRLQDLRR